MKTNYFKKAFAAMIIVLFTHSANAQQYIFVENFNGNFTYPPTEQGWEFQNNSNPANYEWFQGFYTSPTSTVTYFPAYSGADTSYLAASFLSTTANGDISNWALTPEVTLTNGNILKFYTRAINHDFAERLQVYMSTDGTGNDVGSTTTSVGTFSVLLKDINPTLSASAYPIVWTAYTCTVTGLSGSLNGRFGFRYFVTDGGSAGSNSNYIGIDSITYFAPIYAGFSTVKGKNINVATYPNPVKNELTISGLNGKAQVYDILGKLVFSTSFESGNPINTGSLEKGIYVVKIFSEQDEFIKSQKINKE